MWGYGVERTFATTCATALSPDTVGDLERAWFHATDDVVTATPAVVGDTVYTGDWAGVVYALERESGEERWRFQTAEHRNVYAGQIVSSPAVADVDDERLVVIGAGKTLYALAAADGTERWHHELGEAGDADEPTEIESSPVVVGGLAIVGLRRPQHARIPGRACGRSTLATGHLVWDVDLDREGGHGGAPTGCVDVWSSPSVDGPGASSSPPPATARPRPEGWGDYTEAMFAVDLEGDPGVEPTSPTSPTTTTSTSPGPPTCSASVTGTSSASATRTAPTTWSTGRPASRSGRPRPPTPGLEQEGSNFSTGGFIGGTAVSDGVVAGGTGVGPCPCAHGIDAATGEILWQNEEPAATYASAAVANGVLFLGGNDFTLRALDLATGEILWSEEMQGAVSGGAVVSGDDLFAVAGIREPGLDERSETSGVYRFSLGADAEPTETTPSTTAADDAAVTALEPDGLPCIDAPCPVDFEINDPPPGTRPELFVQLAADPLAIEVTATDLGAPEDWVRQGSAAAREGATRFGVFLSARDDDPFGGGGLVCSWAEGEDGCTGTVDPSVRGVLQPPERAGDRRRDDRADAVGRRRPAGAHAELRPAAAGRGTVGS